MKDRECHQGLLDGVGTSADDADLAERVRRDPALGRDLDLDRQLHVLLQHALTPTEPTAFVGAVMATIRADDRGFAAGVMRAVRTPVAGRGTRHLRLAAAGVAALLVLGVGLLAADRFVLPRLEPLVRIATPGAECSVRRDGVAIPIDEQEPLYAGDAVLTGDLPVVLYRQGEHLYLFPRSHLILEPGTWRLERGALRLTTDGARTLATEHAAARIAMGTALLEHSSLGTLLRVERGHAVLTRSDDGSRSGLVAGRSEMVMVPPDLLDADAYVTGD